MSQYDLRMVRKEDLSYKFLYSLKDYFDHVIEKTEDRLTAEFYFQEIMELRYQLWVVVHKADYSIGGIGVSVLHDHPTGERVARVLLLSSVGTASFEDCYLEFIEWAKQVNADEIEFKGRAGWQRALKIPGLKHKYTVMCHRLEK